MYILIFLNNKQYSKMVEYLHYYTIFSGANNIDAWMDEMYRYS